MRALVTGGTGFIGANLVAELNERGIAARVLHRPRSSLVALDGLYFESVHGDILEEPEQLARAMEGSEWVFHVAAVSDYWRQGREWLYRVNVEGTRNVLAAAQLAGVRRLVFTSSLTAMGTSPCSRPLDESNHLSQSPQQFPYAHSKVLGEQAVQQAIAGGLDAVIVNPSVVLGPRDVNRGGGSIILEAARGLLRFSAPGGANFIAVEDVVAGHLAAAERGRTGERYILGAHNLTFDEVTATVCEVVGRRPPLFRLRRWMLPPVAVGVAVARGLFGNRIPLDATHVRLMGACTYADSSKARREFDLPQTPFPTMVKRAYNWYRVNGYL
ncbi:MAG: NAD-dependent epimerase/dehydratase family protein [Anaerolineae bacterium]|nr:NAD-dependent epimerase/dehydratase family protein [Anaerolineae bacterium]